MKVNHPNIFNTKIFQLLTSLKNDFKISRSCGNIIISLTHNMENDKIPLDLSYSIIQLQSGQVSVLKQLSVLKFNKKFKHLAIKSYLALAGSLARIGVGTRRAPSSSTPPSRRSVIFLG